MKKQLPKFLDFKNYPPELNASLAVGNELDILFWVVLPVLLLRHVMSTVFRQEPEVAARCFSIVLDETGNFCPSKLDARIHKFVIERLESAIQEARQTNSSTALELINYAAQEDPAPELIERFMPDLKKIVASLPYPQTERDDAQQSAAVCLLEELYSLRTSREKLFKGFF